MNFLKFGSLHCIVISFFYFDETVRGMGRIVVSRRSFRAFGIACRSMSEFFKSLRLFRFALIFASTHNGS